MPDHPGRKAADEYLLQRIQGASPEQLVAMLLEGGQRFIGLTLHAMKARDLPGQARYVGRTADIVQALKERLNREAGGELVDNLDRIYDWWMNELFDGAQNNQPRRLELVSTQMSELKETWEELHRRKAGGDTEAKPPRSLDEFSV